MGVFTLAIALISVIFFVYALICLSATKGASWVPDEKTARQYHRVGWLLLVYSVAGVVALCL